MSLSADGSRPFAVLPRGLSPLGYRNYLLYWIGFAATNAGRWIELTGSVWIVYELARSPVLLGLLGVVRAVPAIALGPIAGVVADRADQRRLLFLTQSLALVASLSLGILIVSGRVELWHIYLQVGVQEAIMAFDAATRQALFPRLVPRQHMSEAVTLSAIAGRASKLVGPAIGGLAIAGLGEGSPFLINAVTFLGLMAAVLGMRDVAGRIRSTGSTMRGELIEGLRYMNADPILRGLIKMEVIFSTFQINPVMITIIGREVLGVGPEGLGGLLSAPALGSLLGISVLLVVGLARRPGRFAVVCTLAYSIALVICALAANYLVVFVSLAVLGLLDAVVSVTRQSVMQLAAPGPMRGRVMANMGTVTRGAGPLAQTQSGLLAGLVGGPLAIGIAAGVLAVGAAITGRTNHTLWRFSRQEAVGGPEEIMSTELADTGP